jgi:Domain of unknown function (DUF305)
MPIQYVADRTDNSAETSFMSENETAMSKMMTDMMVKPTGDIDRDFVAMMVPHHQGAVDMAQAVLSNGRNEQIRRLAQEIIVTQQQEIAAMRLAIGDPLPPSEPSPTKVSASSQSGGSAIVNTVGPIRQIVQGEEQMPRRYLAIAEGRADKPGPVVQVQLK